MWRTCNCAARLGDSVSVFLQRLPQLYFEKAISGTLKCARARSNTACPFVRSVILVPRAYDPSGLRQESRALGATISGMRHRCRPREAGWAELGYFLCYFKMVSPRALDSCRRPEGSKALGTRMSQRWENIGTQAIYQDH